MAWWHKPDPPDMEGYVPDNFYNGPDPERLLIRIITQRQ